MPVWHSDQQVIIETTKHPTGAFVVFKLHTFLQFLSNFFWIEQHYGVFFVRTLCREKNMRYASQKFIFCHIFDCVFM